MVPFRHLITQYEVKGFHVHEDEDGDTRATKEECETPGMWRSTTNATERRKSTPGEEFQDLAHQPFSLLCPEDELRVS